MAIYKEQEQSLTLSSLILLQIHRINIKNQIRTKRTRRIIERKKDNSFLQTTKSISSSTTSIRPNTELSNQTPKQFSPTTPLNHSPPTNQSIQPQPPATEITDMETAIRHILTNNNNATKKRKRILQTNLNSTTPNEKTKKLRSNPTTAQNITFIQKYQYPIPQPGPSTLQTEVPTAENPKLISCNFFDNLLLRQAINKHTQDYEIIQAHPKGKRTTKRRHIPSTQQYTTNFKEIETTTHPNRLPTQPKSTPINNQDNCSQNTYHTPSEPKLGPFSTFNDHHFQLLQPDTQHPATDNPLELLIAQQIYNQYTLDYEEKQLLPKGKAHRPKTRQPDTDHHPIYSDLLLPTSHLMNDATTNRNRSSIDIQTAAKLTELPIQQPRSTFAYNTNKTRPQIDNFITTIRQEMQHCDPQEYQEDYHHPLQRHTQSTQQNRIEQNHYHPHYLTLFLQSKNRKLQTFPTSRILHSLHSVKSGYNAMHLG
ncbi:hypothetical protein CHS0354_040679 [Potamilus streckersoni]|uniref:Uncharacterized protein n=1 Tax=Potamilus streckersoni TaxID=2493646 RepID=A0AAE0SL50_9BIVA|nr:hypothetical protein CHS0354_040679 [Potamilus streckersoni]